MVVMVLGGEQAVVVVFQSFFFKKKTALFTLDRSLVMNVYSVAETFPFAFF